MKLTRRWLWALAATPIVLPVLYLAGLWALGGDEYPSPDGDLTGYRRTVSAVENGFTIIDLDEDDVAPG